VIFPEGVITSQSAGLEINVAIRTDVGCQRDRNEDSAVFIRPGDPGLLTRKGVLTVVADGIGGHSAGETASRMAVDIIGRRYFEHPGEWRPALVESLRDANAAILERSRGSDALRDMGTTCTALVIREGFAWCGHVGDSRLYLVRQGRIYAMTEDHSAVMEKVRLGLLTIGEARRHADRNIILRALGSKADVCVDTWDEPFPVASGDRFIVCSDGLYDVVDDFEISFVVANTEPPDAAQRLIALACERGAPDNVTAVVIAIQPRSDGERVKSTREGGALP
jgi:protein phosphatase